MDDERRALRTGCSMPLRTTHPYALYVHTYIYVACAYQWIAYIICD